jgi:homoserine O-acetyltransferase
MQVLEWPLLYPEQVRAIAVIAASGRHSAWCIGLSEAQRQAVYAIPFGKMVIIPQKTHPIGVYGLLV